MRKILGLVALAVLGAVLSASLVLTILTITEDRTDKVASQNKKLREEISGLVGRIKQLEHLLREEGIDVPPKGGGTEQTDSSQQPGAAPTFTPGQAAP